MGVGDDACKFAQSKVGGPYIWGGTGPRGYDCSGLMQGAYLNGPKPGFDIGRIVWNQVASARAGQNGGKMLWDVMDPNRGDPKAVKLQVGDVFSYGKPADYGSERGHTRMVAPTGMVAAESTQIGIVNLPTVGYDSGPNDPLYGIARYGGGGGAGGGDGSGSGSGGGGGSNQAQKLKDTFSDVFNQATSDLPDPRDNRPFSPFFMGQIVPLAPDPLRPGTPADNASGGSFAFDLNNVSGKVMPYTTLVRGGISELMIMGPRPRGQFKCYFMMNPESIATALDINMESITNPADMDPRVLQSSTYPVTNVSINFTIIFNRMYEVWHGDFHGPDGKGGPSDIGVRWDIRALERLMGMYDATTEQGGNLGSGNFGTASRPPVSMPIQVVFGGPNSIQFQGVIGSVDYTYTRFDRNMIPTEATVDLGIMRRYTPSDTSADLINALIQVTGRTGTPYAPNSFANFDAVSGAGPMVPSGLTKIGRPS